MRRFRVEWLVVALVIAVAAGIRIRLRNVPLERDEGEYAYAGQLILRGIPPYTFAYNIKLPGTYVAYAVSMALFGETIAGARAGLILANAATTFLIFLLGRRLRGPPEGAVAAAAFAFLSLQTEVLGLFGHATHFVVLSAMAGLLALIRAIDRDRASLLPAGILLGLAPLMKQPGIVFPAFALSWLIVDRRAAGESAGRIARRALVFLAGVAVPAAATILLVLATGVGRRFVFWVFSYAAQYESLMPVREGLTLLREALLRIVPQAFVLWGLAGLGVAAAILRGGRRERGFLLGLLAFSFAGTCAGLYFREHYFILMLPAVAFLAASGCRAFAHRGIGMGIVGMSAILVAVVQTVWAQRRVLLQESSPPAVSRLIYGEDPFPEAVEVGRYIRERTSPADRIVVFGSEPEIYFYADRRSATGHIYMYGLMEEQPFASRMQEEMIREVSAAGPAYLVWVKVRTSWLERPGSDRRIIEWGADLVRDRYVLVGRFDRTPSGGSSSSWDSNAGGRPFDDATFLLVFRRRDFTPGPAAP